jgi:large-conductance mechanosensitive channel
MQSTENAGLAKLKQFIVDNNIVGTSAGVCVALAAKDGIEALVGDIIIPLIIMLLHALRIDGLSKFLPVNGHSQLNITDFVKQMITFILIIIISFIFVQFAFGYLLGVNTTVKDNSANSANSNAADTGLNADAVKSATMAGNSSNPSPKEKFGNYFDINDPF